MGVPRLKGYINNDEKLDFIAYISTTENFEDDFTCSGELDEMIKTSKICNRNCKEEKRVVFTLLFSLRPTVSFYVYNLRPYFPRHLHLPYFCFITK